MKNITLAVFTILSFLFLPTAVCLAGEADVVGVKAEKEKGVTWTFSVTVMHADEGWDHYADRWDVVGPEGHVLATRVLYHPHVGEQPFTRSLAGVEISESISSVILRAHDSVHGYGGKEAEVELKLR
jgi:hypothetical protein